MDRILQKIKILPGSALKILAIITMLIDHTGAIIIRSILRHYQSVGDTVHFSQWAEQYTISRNIGRIAFPIFCFLIVERFLHTEDTQRYARRLFIFALVSAIPFDLALQGNWYFPEKSNVYFTLLLGMLAIWAMQYFHEKPLFGLVCAAAAMTAAYLLKTDYGYRGVLLIVALYVMRFSLVSQCITGAVAVSWEYPAPWAYLPVLFYNGKRGRQIKYFFYFFYPCHLLLLYAAKIWLLPQIL